MPVNSNVDALRESAPVVLPSLLLCDFGNLRQEVDRLEAAQVKGLHLDVMDGHFVPNFTYGMTIVEAFRRLTDLPLDVHLMMSNPQDYLTQFRDAGADLLTVHIEAVDGEAVDGEAGKVLERIHDLGMGAGIALNPNTPLSQIDDCLELVDLVLVMSVDAGFGGQSFNEAAIEKLQRLRETVDERVMLEVDGGINAETIARCAQAGAKYFVVGSAIFRQDDYAPVVRELTRLASN